MPKTSLIHLPLALARILSRVARLDAPGWRGQAPAEAAALAVLAHFLSSVPSSLFSRMLIALGGPGIFSLSSLSFMPQ